MARFDVFYQLVIFILRPFQAGNLSKGDTQFVAENARKHAKVLWLNFGAIILVAFGLQSASSDAIGQIITALIAPVMVMGAAWFAVSFGGIPKHLMNIAMSVTFWMFAAFLTSLSTMFVAVLYSVHPIMWPVFVLIYLGAFISCVLYDTADGLKVGLDEAVLKHSRAALLYYIREGISPDDQRPT